MAGAPLTVMGATALAAASTMLTALVSFVIAGQVALTLTFHYARADAPPHVPSTRRADVRACARACWCAPMHACAHVRVHGHKHVMCVPRVHLFVCVLMVVCGGGGGGGGGNACMHGSDAQ